MSLCWNNRAKGLKFVLMAALAVSLAASVSACGRKGPLELETEEPAKAEPAKK
ncbi:MAG: lipoprotein [Neomegalonema sp.]|nr:lipoprotein [Neomegalonema sp.]